jgi:surfeit locus 1 family protein
MAATNQPRRGLVGPAIATLIAFAILCSLGVWQVKRLHWKEALIARVTARLDAPPILAPGPREWPDLNADLEYQPVTVSGRFLHNYEAHMFIALTEPRGHYGGMGYFVMTPLETDDGWMVFVNRGFVPEDRKYPSSRPAGQVDGKVTITGLFRAPYSGSWFSPANDIKNNIWFSRDPELYAEGLGLPVAKIAPYTIDARFDPKLEGGLPQGGETIIDFPNNHLGYAITWFGLAAGLLGVFLVFARGRLREK